MHSVLFSVKRAFHKSTWFGRALLGGYNLTPSRFDVLYILKTTSLPNVWQSSLRKIPGVTAATTSIMLRALERLGLLQRKKSEDDKRQIEISLTDLGRELIARAIASLKTKTLIDYFVKRLVTPTWWNDQHSFAALERIDDSLRVMRNQLKDSARLSYPWHPED